MSNAVVRFRMISNKAKGISFYAAQVVAGTIKADAVSKSYFDSVQETMFEELKSKPAYKAAEKAGGQVFVGYLERQDACDTYEVTNKDVINEDGTIYKNISILGKYTGTIEEAIAQFGEPRNLAAESRESGKNEEGSVNQNIKGKKNLVLQPSEEGLS